MSETELLDEVMQLRRSLCDIEEYEINWAVGTGENMAKVQLMAVTALNRPIPVAAPSPGTGAPTPTTHEKPPHKWFPEPGVGWKCGHCFALRRVHGGGENELGMDYRRRGGRTWLDYEPDCIGTFSAHPAVPAASPGAGEAVAIDDLCSFCEELRATGHDSGKCACPHPSDVLRERLLQVLYRFGGTRRGRATMTEACADALVAAIAAAPAVPAAEPGKPATCGGQCVKHGDEMHSVHEYEPGVAARWALQDNIGRCPYVVPPTPGKEGASVSVTGTLGRRKPQTGTAWTTELVARAIEAGDEGLTPVAKQRGGCLGEHDKGPADLKASEDDVPF